MITALIVDDEVHNRETLRTLLNRYCPEINILDEAFSVEDAFPKITIHKPQLVFLDIKMPGKSGFDLLKKFTEINFDVIFITAFDRYAIRAFEFNALGYILKPIDVTKLVKTVSRAVEKIRQNKKDELVVHFVKTLSDTSELLTNFSVHHNGKVIFLAISDIAFVEAKDEHTTLTLFDNAHYYSSKDIVKYESVLEGSGNFMRINKSVIINTACIKSYSKGEPCVIELKTGHAFEVSRRRKTEILKKLKEL